MVRNQEFWRAGRAAEGAPLLREYGVCSSIEGSNPSLSAKTEEPAYKAGFLVLERGVLTRDNQKKWFDRERVSAKQQRPQGANPSLSAKTEEPAYKAGFLVLAA